MAEGWHLFLYAAFDPAGFVSVDKPPLALWIGVASVKFFGYAWWSVLLPQALEGMAAVAILMHLVSRQFGAPAGLLAGLFLALTPVSVAVDRSSNTDSALVLFLLLAAWALIRGAEEGSRGLLLLAMTLVGLAFDVKMLAACVVLPTFALVYFLGAPAARKRRFADLALGGLILLAVAVPWIALYDLTPPANRPYVGSSPRNSMVDLAIGHNAVGRFVRLWKPRGQTLETTITTPPPVPLGPDGFRTVRGGLYVRAPIGALRLTDGQLAAQVGWLAPLAAMGLLLFVLRERLRPPLAPPHRDMLLWTGWALTYATVYSYAGGIFHFYYLVTLAPPLAALAGVGVVALHREWLGRGWRGLFLPAALLLTAAWQLYVSSSALRGRFDGWGRVLADLGAARDATGDWRAWLPPALAAGVLAAVALLLALPRAWSAGALAVGLVALLVTPAAWALSSVLVKGVATIPSADLARLSPDALARGRTPPIDTRGLIAFLKLNRLGERYLLATSSATLAAPVIIETGEPVMAIGGFHGLDPILTPERFARLVEAREVRFVMRGDLSPTSVYMGGEAAERPITDWITAHGKPVDPAQWRGRGAPLSPRDRTSGMVLWDLRPAEGLVSR